MENIKERTIALIDNLKSVCQTYGLGNDGNEYKIITQVFLYKFLNDKFGYEIKKLSPALASAEKWDAAYSAMSESDRLDLLDKLSPDVPRLYPQHLIANLWNQSNKGDFALIFDATMEDIANLNIDIFATQTTQNTKIPLFEKLTQYVTDDTQRSDFAKALVDKLANFSFEEAFSKHYDFFATIFEYLIKDYNTNGGGKYAEYYTPHAIATIMAKLLVPSNENLHSIVCWDINLNELRNNDEVLDIANQRRTLKIIPPENKGDYTRYYLDSLRSGRKIEIFVLKYYLKEKLKIDFIPRTEASTI